jgi:DNA invertase Pin-like site-specific DNA recombinase
MLTIPTPRRPTYSAIARLLNLDRATVRKAHQDGRLTIAADVIAYDPLLPIRRADLAAELHISRVTLYKALKRNQVQWIDGRAVYTPAPIGRPKRNQR